jgi:hypothetical protein
LPPGTTRRVRDVEGVPLLAISLILSLSGDQLFAKNGVVGQAPGVVRLLGTPATAQRPAILIR